MSKSSRFKPIPINSKKSYRYDYGELPEYNYKYVEPPQYSYENTPQKQAVLIYKKKNPESQDCSEKIKKINSIFRYKLMSNVIRIIYILLNIGFVFFFPYVWNKKSTLKLEDTEYKIILCSIIAGSVVITFFNCCLHNFYMSISIFIIDLFKFLISGKVVFIELRLNNNASDKLKTMGYALCFLFTFMSFITIVLSYKIKLLYKG